MKKKSLIAKMIFAVCCCPAFELHAQSEHQATVILPDSLTVLSAADSLSLHREGLQIVSPLTEEVFGTGNFTSSLEPTRQPVDLPVLSAYRAQPALYPLDWIWGGVADWELHSGFNASLTMGVTCSVGKNRFPGVAFGTGLAGMYAFPVTSRFTVAAGGFLNHITWQGRGGVDFGFSGLAGYRLTDKISIYAYGSKTLVRNAFCPPFLYDDYYTDRLGGMIHFNVSDKFSFSISVEERK